MSPKDFSNSAPQSECFARTSYFCSVRLPQLSSLTERTELMITIATPVLDVASHRTYAGLDGDASRNGSLIFHELSTGEQ